MLRKLFYVASTFALLGLTPALPASASGSTLFLEEPFGASWAAGSEWITATGSTYTPQIVMSNSAVPTHALRLTDAANNRNSAIFFARPQPMSEGLDVSFRQSQWGGSGADGIAFFLQKGTEASQAAGSLGGALGYSAEFGVSRSGLPSGLLGIGLDLFGSFTLRTFGGSDCPADSVLRTPNNLTIRGPGNGTLGYCRLDYVSNADTDWSSGTDSRDGRARSVRIRIDPSTAANPKAKVWICAVATRCDTSTTPTLSVDAPTELVNEPTVRFGFSAGTGGLNNNHEIWDLQVGSVNAFPAAAITTTSLPAGVSGTAYSRTISATGVTPITFAVASGNLPTGLALDPATGEISGTPSEAGTFTFSVRATDSRVSTQSGRTADQAYSIEIAVAPTIAPTVAPSVAPSTSETSTSSSSTTTVAPTTTAATPALPNRVVQNLPERRIVSGGNLVAGSTVRLEASGFTAGETVVVGIAGSPSLLRSMVADDNGDISTRVALPDSTTREITIYAYGQTSKRGVRQTLTVALPATGNESSGAAPVAIGMLIAGAFTVALATRRRLRAD